MFLHVCHRIRLALTVGGLLGFGVVVVEVVEVVDVVGTAIDANNCCSRSLRAAAMASTLMLEACAKL